MRRGQREQKGKIDPHLCKADSPTCSFLHPVLVLFIDELVLQIIVCKREEAGQHLREIAPDFAHLRT